MERRSAESRGAKTRPVCDDSEKPRGEKQGQDDGGGKGGTELERLGHLASS